MSKIFYLMGKSCSGKDTIFKRLKESEELNLKTVTIYTTRPIRAKELNGREYNFVTEKELFEFEKEEKIIEKRDYNTVHGIWTYFTADDGQIDLENDNYIMMGTLESFEKIREHYGQERVIPIYIEVSDEERLERAIRREKKQAQPKYQELCRRFLADSQDFSDENIEKHGVVKRYINTDLEVCIQEILKDITPL